LLLLLLLHSLLQQLQQQLLPLRHHRERLPSTLLTCLQLQDLLHTRSPGHCCCC
jgi:hypothetical protein